MVAYHNTNMYGTLKFRTLKNYFTTENDFKKFLVQMNLFQNRIAKIILGIESKMKRSISSKKCRVDVLTQLSLSVFIIFQNAFTNSTTTKYTNFITITFTKYSTFGFTKIGTTKKAGFSPKNKD